MPHIQLTPDQLAERIDDPACSQAEEFLLRDLSDLADEAMAGWTLLVGPGSEAFDQYATRRIIEAIGNPAVKFYEWPLKHFDLLGAIRALREAEFADFLFDGKSYYIQLP